jgi:hypothetical protein
MKAKLSLAMIDRAKQSKSKQRKAKQGKAQGAKTWAQAGGNKTTEG